jgi:hypothetical protein
VDSLWDIISNKEAIAINQVCLPYSVSHACTVCSMHVRRTLFTTLFTTMFTMQLATFEASAWIVVCALPPLLASLRRSGLAIQAVGSHPPS